jgi:hypothetical protein
LGGSYFPDHRTGLEAVDGGAEVDPKRQPMSRKLKAQERRIRVAMSLAPQIYERLIEASRSEGLSIASYSRRAVMRDLEPARRSAR